jgi:hypothetical protein
MLASEWRSEGRADGFQVILRGDQQAAQGIRGSSGGEAYHMVTHSNEEVKEQCTALLHLELHGAALLEVVTAADDESKVLGSKL